MSAQPLAGKRIAVTRSRKQSSELCEKLSAQGAEVLELPLIEVSPACEVGVAQEILGEIATYEWVVFTSPNGVRYFFQSFFDRFKDIRCFGPMKIACIGEATARALEPFHLEVDLIPEQAVAESLAQALIDTGSLEHAQVLVITGNRNRDVIPKMLEKEGHAIIDCMQVYKTEKTDLSENAIAKAFKENGADLITFTSSSTVESFIDQAEALQLSSEASHPQACSIGPITSESLRKRGISVAIEAKEASIDALVEAIVQKIGS